MNLIANSPIVQQHSVKANQADIRAPLTWLFHGPKSEPITTIVAAKYFGEENSIASTGCKPNAS